MAKDRAHPKYIQAQLGHASIQTTLDRYGHLMPDAHAAEARKLDRLVFGESSHAGSVRVAADALQRLQNGSRNQRRRPLTPCPCVVAGARNAECYTVPEVYWVDLR